REEAGARPDAGRGETWRPGARARPMLLHARRASREGPLSSRPGAAGQLLLAQHEGLVVLDLGGAVGDGGLALGDDLGELLVAVVTDGLSHRATLYHPAPRSWSASDHLSLARKVAAAFLQNSHRT